MASSKKYLQVFKQSYADEFPCIKQSRKGEHYALCTTCRCDVSVSHGGKGDIVAHLRTKKHADNVRSEEKNTKIGPSFFVSADNGVIRAECLFTSFLIEHNIPISCADHAGPLFRQMFKDSEIAKKYGCARTKSTAIIGVFAAEKEDELVNILKQQPFSIATDGSNDSDSKLYPIAVTFFNKSTKTVETSLLSLPALKGDSTGRNIGDLLVSNLKSRDIPLSNCLALGADNAPVMIGHKNGVFAVLKEEHENVCVIGCPCHLINLAAEKSAACLPIKVDEILVDIYYFLEKSSKRKDKLKTFQLLHDADVRKIIKHVCTRWLSLGKCLQRMVEQWQPLVSFFNDEIKTKKKSSPANLQTYKIPKTPSTKTKHTLQTFQCTKHVKTGSSQNPQIGLAEKGSHLATKPKVTINAKPAPNPQNSRVHVDSPSSSGPKLGVKRTAKDIASLPKPLVKKPRAGSSAPSSPTNDLSREERLFFFLTTTKNKAYCLFLLNTIPLFEKTNLILQSQVPHIHVLRSLLLDLFKSILSRFVKPLIIKDCASILQVEYHSRSNQKEDAELVIGSSTAKVVETLKHNEKVEFFESVRQYFIAACNYMVHKFPFQNEVLIHAEVAQMDNIVNASFAGIQYFVDRFPVVLCIEGDESKDAAIDALQSQFCDFQVDNMPAGVLEQQRVDSKWAAVAMIKSMDGIFKYHKLSQVMLAILTMPHSNAECERVFSQVKKTRTQFRSSMSDSSLEKLLITKFRQHGQQCYQQNFDDKLLKKAKSATTVALSKTP